MLLNTHIRHDLKDLDALVRRLPFALDDAEAVGRVFERWMHKPHGKQAQVIDLWTYCYVRRYFLVRFIRSRANYTGADLEEAIERAYIKVARNRAGVRDPLRYARWVLVICRNTWLNYVGRHRDHVPVELVAEPRAEDLRILETHDDAIRASALAAAIDRLPRYLRIHARLRLVEGLGYDVIAERTDIPTASVRAYVHRALGRMREDHTFLAIVGYESATEGS